MQCKELIFSSELKYLTSLIEWIIGEVIAIEAKKPRIEIPMASIAAICLPRNEDWFNTTWLMYLRGPLGLMIKK